MRNIDDKLGQKEDEKNFKFGGGVHQSDAILPKLLTNLLEYVF